MYLMLTTQNHFICCNTYNIPNVLAKKCSIFLYCALKPWLFIFPVFLPRCIRWPGLSDYWGVGKLDAGASSDWGATRRRIAETRGSSWHSVIWWTRDGPMSRETHQTNQWKVGDFRKNFVTFQEILDFLFCLCIVFSSSLLLGLDWLERENFLDVHLTRNRPPPARRRRSGPSQRTSNRRPGLTRALQETSMKIKTCHKKHFSFETNFSDLPSPNSLPQLFQTNTTVGDWPEQAEIHSYSAEQESELGYMDDPYNEETYEELLTPSFFSLERETLHIVELTHAVCID